MSHFMYPSSTFRLALACLLFLVLSLGSSGQRSLQFVPLWKNRTIDSLPCTFSESGNDSTRIDLVRFYCHGFTFYQRGELIWRGDKDHYLVDFSDENSLLLNFPIPHTASIDEVIFYIGVDSTMQMNGAHGGTLDPIQGMYWTWQSGYIHCKIEAQQMFDSMRDTVIWHIGGYRKPFNTIREVYLKSNDKSELMRVGIQLDRMFSADLNRDNYTIMSPSAAACEHANQFVTCFKWYNAQ